MKLFWIDIETTGLDPTTDQILEFAAWMSDLSDPFDANRVCHEVLHYHGDIKRHTPFVQEMHMKNGLWAACYESERTWEDVETIMQQVVPVESDRENLPTLAGSSVHFDQRFIHTAGMMSGWSRSFARRFSHRLYDVSAIKLFCHSLGMPKPPRAEAHRADADVQESIAHAQLCADWVRSGAMHYDSVFHPQFDAGLAHLRFDLDSLHTKASLDRWKAKQNA